MILGWVAPLLILESFFSGSEIALLSADKLALRTAARKGSTRAKTALALIQYPERVLSATLLMTSLCMIAISSIIALHFIETKPEHAELLAVAVTSPLVVIFGELLPKTLFQRYSDRIAPTVAPVVNAVYWSFLPVTRLMSSYTGRISKLIGPLEEIITGKKRSTRDEIQSLLTYSKRESELKSSERRMIKRIFDFKDAEAKHALIPLVKIEGVEKSSTVRQALERFRQHRHSRMPVYDGRIDNIVGVIDLTDLATSPQLDAPMAPLISEAYYVAETQGLRDLLLEMRRDDAELVVIVDEYGGAVGILTFEDIVEEITGEIEDEYDVETQPWKQLSEETWLIQARMEVSLINERLRLELPEGEYETLGGFLLQQFGRIPESGDELFFDTPAAALKFSIRKANARTIETVLVEKMTTDRDNQA
jgi:CBS domain containing-hemolysin-like protein